MAASRMILLIVLASTFGLACSTMGISPTARYKIIERFPERLGPVEVVGVEVRSALPVGVISEADLEKLASFISERLQRFTIGVIANINGGADAERMEVILTIDISLFEVATQEQRRNRVPSYLHGTVSLHRVATGRNLGTAIVWARGGRLDLDTNNVPDTVQEFAFAIRQIY
jgi:hypothetical protein